MVVYITKKFDDREVGTMLDLHESVANELIKRGYVSEQKENQEVKSKKIKK
jgi:hypothetical protein